MQGALARGEDVDVDEWLRINKAIWEFMPAANPDFAPADVGDPLDVLFDAVMRTKNARLVNEATRHLERDEMAEIDRLRLRVAELEGENATALADPPSRG